MRIRPEAYLSSPVASVPLRTDQMPVRQMQAKTFPFPAQPIRVTSALATRSTATLLRVAMPPFLVDLNSMAMKITALHWALVANQRALPQQHSRTGYSATLKVFVFRLKAFGRLRRPCSLTTR